MSKKHRIPKERPPDPHGIDVDWRIFLALPLPEPVVTLAQQLISDVATDDWPMRWVNPDAMHLTLHFLGEVPTERAELLRLALPRWVARHQAFTLSTGGLGVFPSTFHPRVLWLGVEGEIERLAALHKSLGRNLAELEFELEERAFSPHITLGRVRDNPPADLGQRITTRIADPVLVDKASAPISLPVEQVVLYRSIPERGGHRYEPLIRAKLAPANG